MKEKSSLRGPSAPTLRVKRELYWKQPLIAALITIVCFYVMCMVSNIYPFGKYVIMASDLEAQYTPFLFLYRRHLMDLDWSHPISSFTYSSELGLGKNLMGTFGYYLASPVNLIILLFKPSQASLFIMTLIGIKLSLASAFMCMFINKRSSKPSRLPMMFGIMYAFSSYTMVYMMNIMWLDGYALLPLLLYFIEDYLEDERHRFHKIAITLVFLFVTNYYIAYMAGVFSFFYLIVRMIETDRFAGGVKSGLKLIGRFILTAVLSALSVCVVLLPVAIDTLVNADPTHAKPSENYVYFSVVDMTDRVFLGSPGDFAEIMPSNLPFIFISLVVTFAIALYFISDVFKGKNRKIYAVLLGLIYLSLAIKPLDLAWQAFDDPNWFWHRQSFVFLPFFLVIALQVIEKIREIPNRDIAKATGILLLLLFVAQSFGEMKKLDSVFLVNLLLIVCYAAILMLLKKDKWPAQLANMDRLLPFIMALVVVFETAGIATVLSGGIAALSVYYGEGEPHEKSILAMEDAANAADKLNRGYRFDLEHNFEGDDIVSISDNSAMYVGYNGVSLFNSNSNKPLHRFLKQLGYSVNYDYFAARYSFTAEDTDAFLSIGSVAARMDYTGATYVGSDGYDSGIDFYYRDLWLPLGFAVDAGAPDFDFYKLELDKGDKDYLDFRNEWYHSMFPDVFDQDFYIGIDAGEPEYINCYEFDMSEYSTYSQDYIDSVAAARAAGEDVEVPTSDAASSTSASGFDPDDLGNEPQSQAPGTHTLYRTNTQMPLLIKFTITAPTDDEIYMNLSANRVLNKCQVYVNGRMTDSWGDFSFFSQVIRLGAFEPGEEVEVAIMSKSNKYSYQNVSFSYLDSETFRSMLSQVDTSKVTLDDIENGRAGFTCDLDEGEILLTTIPYEDGWTAYVDGKKVDIIDYQDALIAIDCGSGHHEVELVFVAPGIKPGAVISIVGILGFVALGIYDHRKKKTGGKSGNTSDAKVDQSK